MPRRHQRKNHIIGSLMDSLSLAQRSENMRRIRGKNTSPEMIVRRAIFSKGYRFRLHLRALPGCPDIVFPKAKRAVFVHGCFWHRHIGCKNCTTPKSNVEFWNKKLTSNQIRDQANLLKLRSAKWRVLVLWECEIEKPGKIWKRLGPFLGSIKKQDSSV